MSRRRTDGLHSTTYLPDQGLVQVGKENRDGGAAGHRRHQRQPPAKRVLMAVKGLPVDEKGNDVFHQFLNFGSFQLSIHGP
jgi:hypothetical protein